jgi:penicillin amidase
METAMNRALKILTASLTGLSALAGVGYYALFRRPLPHVSGTITLAGLDASVEVIRDRWGVPHIYASTTHDAYFAQGFVHAQDRLWHMELNRRVGSGRLVELFGEIALETDRWVRILGFRRAAEGDFAALDAASRALLEAYAAGVNAFLDRRAGRLPIEFVLLHHRPERWQPVDTLVWAKVMAWGLSNNWDMEIHRARLISRLGEEIAAQLEPFYRDDHPVIVPDVDYVRLGETPLSRAEAAGPFLGGGPGAGSNNWVVHGSRTDTGQPLLANDPHLAMQMPSIWYENHLSSEDGLDVIGVTFPGVPGVIIGHNRHVAWGVTNGSTDCQDLYVERVNPDNNRQVEYQGEWEDVQVVYETIQVKGRATPVTEPVSITRHGPIITPLVPGETQALALRWTAHEPGTIVRAVAGINRASNWGEFQAALRDWDVPSQNFVYADVAGNIGYTLAGKIPIRARGDGRTPVPGWTDEYEWTGYIPFEELPRSFNPAKGYVVTANNRPVDDSYPHPLAGEWLNGFRAQRIIDLLMARDKVSNHDFRVIHTDVYSLPGREMADYLVQLSTDDSELQQAIGYLKAWDHQLSADSIAGAIYEAFLLKMLRNTFGGVVGDLIETYLGTGPHLLLSPVNGYMGRVTVVLLRFMAQNPAPWPGLGSESRWPTRDDCAHASLREAIDELKRVLGPDVTQWTWGRLHSVIFAHPMGQVKPLNRLFNRGPYPLGGDTDTVWQAAFIPGRPYGPESFTASYRQIIDLGNLANSVCVNTTGQSGQPGSRHYDDQIDDWRFGRYHPMLFDRVQVEEQAEARLELVPGQP